MSTSELFYIGFSSILTCSYTFLDGIWELHVHSPAFNQDCAAYSKRIAKGPPSDDSDSYYSDDNSILEKDSSSSRYDVSKLEANLYYFGIRGPRRRGTKLIFRTSRDIFTAPSGPENDSRLMQLRPVYEHQKLGTDDLCATIRSKVLDFLEVQLYGLTSVPRLWNSSTSEKSGIRPSSSFVSAGLRITSTSTRTWMMRKPRTLRRT